MEQSCFLDGIHCGQWGGEKFDFHIQSGWLYVQNAGVAEALRKGGRGPEKMDTSQWREVN